MSSPDESKQNRWVVVGLSTIGERESNVKLLSDAVRGTLGVQLEIFVPAVSKKHASYYMDGYIFVKYVPGVQYMKLQDTQYFNQVLRSGRGQDVAYSLVDDSTLAPLRKAVKKFGICKFAENDHVRVVKGEYKGMDGHIIAIYDGGETVQVDMSRRSKPVLADYPVIYLEKIEE